MRFKEFGYTEKRAEVRKLTMNAIVMITLKSTDKLQTIVITYDGFNYKGKQIQHGVLLIVKGIMVFDIGGTDEAIDFIQTAVKENGFSAYDEYSLKINTTREIVHAVESLEKTYQRGRKKTLRYNKRG